MVGANPNRHPPWRVIVVDREKAGLRNAQTQADDVKAHLRATDRTIRGARAFSGSGEGFPLHRKRRARHHRLHVRHGDREQHP
jgi:hypothetical protein